MATVGHFALRACAMGAWEKTMVGVAPHTLRAAAFHAVFVGAVTAIKSSTNALYLANRPPQGLAILYVVVAGLMALTTLLLAGPLSARPPRQLLAGGAWAMAALIITFAGLHLVGVPHFLGALYVAAEVYATTLSILFWSTVSTWFDARSSRKAFGLISAGGMAGALVGGLSTRLLAHLVGAAGTAIFGVLVVGLSLGLLGGAGRAAPARSSSHTVVSGARYLGLRRYPKEVAALAAMFSALGACVDYVFRIGAASRMSELELAALFGDLNAGVGGAAILYQLLLTGRVLERGGLFIFLAVIPALLLVTSGAAAVAGGFGLLLLMKALEMAGSFSILQSGMQLLYNPMPSESRPAVRAFIDGVVKKGGMAAAGVGLTVLVGFFPSTASPWLVTVPAAACLFIIHLLRGAYLAALEEKLRGSRARVALTLDVVDKATRQALIRSLGSPRGSEVLAAMDILRRDHAFKPEPHLGDLLTHSDEAVRVAAMELVPANAPPDVEFALASILSLDQRRPRAAAARALARSHPQRAATVLHPYLHDPDPGVTCAVVASLLQFGDPQGEAARRLQELLDSRDAASPGERREVARLLSEVDLGTAVEHLPHYLKNGDATVRVIALQSAARVFSVAVTQDRQQDALPLVPHVQARLANRQDRAEARLALTRLGDAVVPQLRANLDDRSLHLGIRIEIPRLLRLVGTQAAADALLFSNIKDHPSLRYRIAASLFALNRAHPDVPLDRGRTDEALRRRLAAFTQYRPLCHSLAAADATAPRGGPAARAWDLLRRVTTDRLLQNLQMALRLLGLHHGVERMDRAARLLMEAERLALKGARPEEVSAMRADALEVVDVALQGDPIREDVMATLEPPPPRSRDVNVPWHDVAETARALRVSADPLVAVLAQRVLRSGVLMPDEASTPFGVVPPHRNAPKTDPAFTAAALANVAALNDPTDEGEVTHMDEKTLSRILALEKVDLFEGLPVDDLAAMAAIAEERHARGGETLYREGEPGENMMVIVSGKVDLLRDGHPFMQLGPGESLGQVSLLDRGPRPTTAVVATGLDAELLSIGCDAFMDLVMDRPELTRGLFVVLARRLRSLIDLQAGSHHTR